MDACFFVAFLFFPVGSFVRVSKACLEMKTQSAAQSEVFNNSEPSQSAAFFIKNASLLVKEVVGKNVFIQRVNL